ncbi:hypothetical protein NQ315_008948 [Exocentrus adspersus]|uniref:DDE Tnp4 domain-containing protein n=1 Tax=Exocentrus adspersus TaxID=1586481 RepID=A0AAV8V8Z1_9CUCU|nr:hypothetical protein NQ315_008948 [Exocentrus adspersus]
MDTLNMLPYFAVMMQEVQENERRNEINQFNIERRIMRNDSDPFALSDNQFKNTFRLTKDMINYLFEQLLPHMRMDLRTNAVNPRLRIFAALYFYANGSYQRVIGNSYSLSMAQNTVIAMVHTICDYGLKIMNVNPQFPGATHDSYIWRMSQIQRELQTCFGNGDHNTWLLGDSGYPQQPWLMTPVLNPAQGSPEERYNNTHASARNCIERCFGVLKGRFRCLLGERTLRYSPEKVGTIVVACAVLHNLCIAARLEEDYNIQEVEQPRQRHNQADENNQDQNEGRARRRLLIERYFSEN